MIVDQIDLLTESDRFDSMYIDSNLKWDDHINSVILKITQRKESSHVYVINILPIDTLMQLL